jgi:hypothetical protein
MAGIQRFGRLLSKTQKAKLGFIKHNTPALGTLTETMKALGEGANDVNNRKIPFAIMQRAADARGFENNDFVGGHGVASFVFLCHYWFFGMVVFLRFNALPPSQQFLWGFDQETQQSVSGCPPEPLPIPAL